MKHQLDYQSSLAGHISDFIAFKRMQDYNYTNQAEHLKRFDFFLVNQKYTDSLLQREIMNKYCDQTVGSTNNTRARLHSILRHFSLHLHAIEPKSKVLPAHKVPRQIKKTRFYPLDPSQIMTIMNAADKLHSSNGLRSHGIRFLIGLLYSTGLRIAEALSLGIKDIDTHNRTLFVHRGKFGKDRIISLSDSTYNTLEKWLKIRSPYAANETTAPLLIDKHGKRLSYSQAYSAFRRLCVLCDIAGDPSPRLHDLRHNYACRCIARWREANEDVNALLPVLANAMGHVDFTSTQVYLHIDAAALRQASVKFNQHIKQPQEKI